MSKRDKINKLIKDNVNEVNTFATKISGLIYNEKGDGIEEVILQGKYPVPFDQLTKVQKDLVLSWQTDNELLEECILLNSFGEEEE